MFKRIPILMYHSIEPVGSKRIREEERFYNVTPDRFKKQMHYLKENGYSTMTLSELIRIENDRELPRKPVMLTFDDGHISHYDTVLPILKENGFSGVFFLVSNDIGKKYRISWEQARILKDAGMEIGSHGANHTILNKSSFPDLIFELEASKIELEDNLETKIQAFSIPRGLYSRKISDVARGMGYKLVFTSFAGNTTLYSDPYCLKRIVMRRDYSIKEFISIVNKDIVFLTKKRLEQFTKNGIQKTIGVNGYDWIKKSVFSKA